MKFVQLINELVAGKTLYSKSENLYAKLIDGAISSYRGHKLESGFDIKYRPNLDNGGHICLMAECLDWEVWEPTPKLTLGDLNSGEQFKFVSDINKNLDFKYMVIDNRRAIVSFSGVCYSTKIDSELRKEEVVRVT